MKVAKFGGTSLAGAEEFTAVATRILKDEEIKIAVVSAGGKKAGQPKVTDSLIAAYKTASAGGSVQKALAPFAERLQKLTAKLKLQLNIENLLMKIERGFITEPTPDFLISRGEYAYSLIAAEYLGRPFVDAAEIMKFNEDGTFNYGFSDFLIRETYARTGGFVTGGFYGSFPDGKIKTLTRGGSDFSGAVIAAATNCDYYNYTDVSGFYDFDPSKIKCAKTIKKLSFRQARILSEFGAGVLHPDSVLPLMNTDLKIYIKNTFSPLSDGTVVSKEGDKETFAAALGKNYFGVRLYGAGKGSGLLSSLTGEKFAPVLCVTDEDCVCAVIKGSGENFCDGLRTEKTELFSDMRLAYFTDSPNSEKGVASIKDALPVFMSAKNRDGYYLSFAAVYEEKFIKILEEFMTTL